MSSLLDLGGGLGVSLLWILVIRYFPSFVSLFRIIEIRRDYVNLGCTPLYNSHDL